MPDQDAHPSTRDEFWLEEFDRGSTQLLIVHFRDEARGSFIVNTPEEKCVWLALIPALNLIYKNSPTVSRWTLTDQQRGLLEYTQTWLNSIGIPTGT